MSFSDCRQAQPVQVGSPAKLDSPTEVDLIIESDSVSEVGSENKPDSETVHASLAEVGSVSESDSRIELGSGASDPLLNFAPFSDKNHFLKLVKKFLEKIKIW